jgi:ankyrin repeat protein
LSIAAFFNLREIAGHLVAAGDRQDHFAIWAAADKGHMEMVTILVKSVNVNYCGHMGTPLHTATVKGNEEMVRLLLEHGAEVNSSGSADHGGCPLYEASRHGYLTIVGVLIENAAKIDYQTTCHSTALQAASNAGHTEIVRLLLDNNANANLISIQKPRSTALLCAVAQGHEEITRMLIDHGADVNLQTEQGTALQVASYKGQSRIARLLIQEGARPTGAGGPNGTALESAMYGGHKDIVFFLLQQGPDSSSRDPVNLTNDFVKHVGGLRGAACEKVDRHTKGRAEQRYIRQPSTGVQSAMGDKS